MRALLTFLAFFGIVLASTPAAEPRQAVDFAREVLPLLQRSCIECHGPEKQKGRLRLDLRDSVLNGKVIVPGKPDESELVRRISRPKGETGVMPGRGDTLSKSEIGVIRDWISRGALWPANLQTARHWAYAKPSRPTLPEVRNVAWTRNAVDHFVLARLEKEGLKPSPEADKATLIRRVSLDLSGLPPSPMEVENFLRAWDAKPQAAYEELADRLLASPQFGERWARPWLDLARYADSHGFQRDDLREVWAYRDWVINALNADMPFDLFTRDQIAGDLLPNATEAQKIATGFHRCTPTNVEAGSDPEETRVNQVIDRVNTTAAVWLGSTLECAQCHDHKYDPFTQKDYFRLFSFFNNTALEADRSNPKVPGSIRFLGPTMTLSSDANAEERARLNAALRQIEIQLADRKKELMKDVEKWEASLTARLDQQSQTHTLEVEEFVSAGGAPHRKLEDHSILLVDDPPDKDTYTVTVHTTLKNITGFKLEALTDPSLPGKGPGRGDAQRPNFVLNTFDVVAAPHGKDEKPKPIKLTGATASFSQKNFDAAGAIDNDPKTAWAINPKFHQDHWVIFTTDNPLGFDQGTVLTFRLVQEFGSGRTIGRLRLSAITGDPKGKSLPSDVIAALRTPKDKRTGTQTDRLLDYRLSEDATGARLRDQRTRIEQDLQKLKPPTSLVIQELSQPRSTHLFQRGDFRNPGDKVDPGTPTVLHPLVDTGGSDRLALASWLTNRDNPLVARVTVNRWWADIFGRGLVTTVEDFGVKGERPTHPELLDWLAVEFMDGGWSMKHVLRLIVTSAAYRQSSKLTPELLAKDDQNRFLARGPRFRMDAEMIRDNALSAAGLLSLKMNGPSVRPFQPDGLWTKIGGERVEYVTSPGLDSHRRGVYIVWKRASPYPSMVNFDATARLACTVKRSRSNTPLQALTLMNDPVYVEAAKALAKRVLMERAEANVDEKIAHAFRLCLTRSPKEVEVAVLVRLYEHQHNSARSKPASVRDLIGDFSMPDGVAIEEFAAWYGVATTLLNLDEMITRP